MRKQLTVHRLTENISACTHARADNAADEANTRRATAKNAFYDAHQPSKFVCENLFDNSPSCSRSKAEAVAPAENRTQPPSCFSQVKAHRESKRQKIVEFFMANPGQKFSTAFCHSEWGTSFRTRVSEINRDKSAAITILNKYEMLDGKEVSTYWAEVRQ